MVKPCKFDSSKRCYHSSCFIFDCVSGGVLVCVLYRGGKLFTPRKVVSVPRVLRSGS